MLDAYIKNYESNSNQYISFFKVKVLVNALCGKYDCLTKAEGKKRVNKTIIC